MSSERALSALAERPSLAASAGIFLLSAATIAGAWGFQILGGYIPCKLCLEERIPYYVGVPLALVTLVLALGRRAPEKAVRVLLLVLALIFLASLGLAVYHAGAEWAWWPGPSDCGGGVGTSSSVEDLMKGVDSIRIVFCTEAALRVLGLSFAGWNAVVSLVLAGGALWGALARRA
jgi:disulfide bond formation protein DsbB